MSSVRVYAIRNRSSPDTYIGTTTQPLTRRFTRHKSSRETWLKGKTNHCSSFPIVACPTAYIELLEECDEGDRKVRERWWVENTPNCVNKCVPGREMKEYQHDWYLKNKEENNERSRKYVETNREKVREYQKAYRQANKERNRINQQAYRERQKLSKA